MKTRTINIYKFSELSDEAKEKAINKLWNINVDYEWHDFTIADAKNVFINITEFDIDKGTIKGSFDYTAEKTANAIIKDHGKDCDSYKTAEDYLRELKDLTDHYTPDEIPDDDLNDLDEEFLGYILEDYRMMLQKEYKYLTSKEAIIETIDANDYDFLEDGTLA